MNMSMSARDLVQFLFEKNMSAQEISEAMENRISPRTIYRWAKGESEPGNTTDLDVLRELVQVRGGKESSVL